MKDIKRGLCFLMAFFTLAQTSGCEKSKHSNGCVQKEQGYVSASLPSEEPIESQTIDNKKCELMEYFGIPSKSCEEIFQTDEMGNLVFNPYSLNNRTLSEDFTVVESQDGYISIEGSYLKTGFPEYDSGEFFDIADKCIKFNLGSREILVYASVTLTSTVVNIKRFTDGKCDYARTVAFQMDNSFEVMRDFSEYRYNDESIQLYINESFENGQAIKNIKFNYYGVEYQINGPWTAITNQEGSEESRSYLVSSLNTYEEVWITKKEYDEIVDTMLACDFTNTAILLKGIINTQREIDKRISLN